MYYSVVVLGFCGLLLAQSTLRRCGWWNIVGFLAWTLRVLREKKMLLWLCWAQRWGARNPWFPSVHPSILSTDWFRCFKTKWKEMEGWRTPWKPVQDLVCAYYFSSSGTIKNHRIHTYYTCIYIIYIWYGFLHLPRQLRVQEHCRRELPASFVMSGGESHAGAAKVLERRWDKRCAYFFKIVFTVHGLRGRRARVMSDTYATLSIMFALFCTTTDFDKTIAILTIFSNKTESGKTRYCWHATITVLIMLPCSVLYTERGKY